MQMKRNFLKLLSIVALCNWISAIHAQYNTLNEWYIGPTGGVTFSTVTLVPKMVDKLYLMGQTEGFSTRYVSENHFGFQLDLSYFEAGWKEDLYQQKKASEYTYARSLRFLDMPFLMHTYTKAGATRFFLNVGSKIDWLLSEKKELKDQTTENDMRQHDLQIEHPFQYGMLAGAGLEIHMKRSVIGLEGRYCYMLSNLFDDTIDSENFSTSNLQTMSVNLFYYFQIGK